jgi:ABC-2 type transport system ATP-binding protein
VFMSSHILADIERVCDTVGIINQGKLVVEANQQELLERYVQPVFELECNGHGMEAFRGFVEGLKAKPWVRAVSLEGPVARVTVRDTDAAEHALLSDVANQAFSLRRYEIVRPSLEDVFLLLVNGNGQEVNQ